jgi:hypothetical protein
MSAASVAPVEPKTVTSIEPLAGPAQVWLGQFHDQVIMVIHQHKRVQPDPEQLDHLTQKFAEMRPIPVVAKNRLPVVASRGDVIPTPCKLDSQWPRHSTIITRSPSASSIVESRGVTRMTPRCLARIKSQFAPRNLFRSNQNIRTVRGDWAKAERLTLPVFKCILGT